MKVILCRLSNAISSGFVASTYKCFAIIKTQTHLTIHQCAPKSPKNHFPQGKNGFF